MVTRAAEISVTQPILVANEADSCDAVRPISGTLTGATRLTYCPNSGSASDPSVMGET